MKLYKENRRQEAERILSRYGIRLYGDIEVEITSERLLDFLQSTELPPQLAHFKRKTKREMAALIAVYAKDKKKYKGKTTFLF